MTRRRDKAMGDARNKKNKEEEEGDRSLQAVKWSQLQRIDYGLTFSGLTQLSRHRPEELC